MRCRFWPLPQYFASLLFAPLDRYSFTQSTAGFTQFFGAGQAPGGCGVGQLGMPFAGGHGGHRSAVASPADMTQHKRLIHALTGRVDQRE